jgi:hypothetical protein
MNPSNKEQFLLSPLLQLKKLLVQRERTRNPSLAEKHEREIQDSIDKIESEDPSPGPNR